MQRAFEKIIPVVSVYQAPSRVKCPRIHMYDINKKRKVAFVGKIVRCLFIHVNLLIVYWYQLLQHTPCFGRPVPCLQTYHRAYKDRRRFMRFYWSGRQHIHSQQQAIRLFSHGIRTRIHHGNALQSFVIQRVWSFG